LTIRERLGAPTLLIIYLDKFYQSFKRGFRAFSARIMPEFDYFVCRPIRSNA
jgi:hypothetical protein